MFRLKPNRAKNMAPKPYKARGLLRKRLAGAAFLVRLRPIMIKPKIRLPSLTRLGLLRKRLAGTAFLVRLRPHKAKNTAPKPYKVLGLVVEEMGGAAFLVGLRPNKAKNLYTCCGRDWREPHFWSV